MTAKPPRVILDTNVVLAGLIAPGSTSSRLVSFVSRSAVILLSVPVVEELDQVFRRPKFDRYQDVDKRLSYLCSFLDAGTVVEVTEAVTDCRDPKDNKFLERALSGNADFIITGDADLLSLHPWRGIALLSPADDLTLLE